MAGKRRAAGHPESPDTPRQRAIPERSYKISNPQPIFANTPNGTVAARNAPVVTASTGIGPPCQLPSNSSTHPPTTYCSNAIQLTLEIDHKNVALATMTGISPDLEPGDGNAEDVWLLEACASNQNDPWDSIIIRQITREFNEKFDLNYTLIMMVLRLEGLIGPMEDDEVEDNSGDDLGLPPDGGIIEPDKGDTGSSDLSEVEDSCDTDLEDLFCLGQLSSPSRVMGNVEGSESQECDSGGEDDVEDDVNEVREEVEDEEGSVWSEKEGEKQKKAVGDGDSRVEDTQKQIMEDALGVHTLEVGDQGILGVSYNNSPIGSTSAENPLQRNTRKRSARNSSTPGRIPRGVGDRFLRSDNQADAESSTEVLQMLGFNRSIAKATELLTASVADRTRFSPIEDTWLINNYPDMQHKDGRTNWGKLADCFELQFGRQRRREALRKSAREEIDADFSRFIAGVCRIEEEEEEEEETEAAES